MRKIKRVDVRIESSLLNNLSAIAKEKDESLSCLTSSIATNSVLNFIESYKQNLKSCNNDIFLAMSQFAFPKSETNCVKSRHITVFFDEKNFDEFKRFFKFINEKKLCGYTLSLSNFIRIALKEFVCNYRQICLQ